MLQRQGVQGAQSDVKSGHKSKKSKKDKVGKGDKCDAQKRKSCVDHHPSLPVQATPQEQAQDTLNVIVNILLGAILLTRNQRNMTKSHTRSPSRRCAPRYRGIRRYMS